MRTGSITGDHARAIIARVTGKRPQSVDVEPGPNMLTVVFRARSDGVLRRYLFEGDAETPAYHYQDLLHEICWQDGCWDPVDTRPTTAAWRDCPRHTSRLQPIVRTDAPEPSK